MGKAEVFGVNGFKEFEISSNHGILDPLIHRSQIRKLIGRACG
jgi:hypothetical protein